MALLSLLSSWFVIMFGLVPSVGLLFYFVFRSMSEERRKTASILECNKHAIEFYQLAIVDMKEMQDHENPDRK